VPELRIGNYGFCYPPFEVCVELAVVAEKQGFDSITYFDQTNGYHPRATHTPEFTALANVVPDHDAFFDSVPLISCAAQQASGIDFVYGVIDSVRRPPHNLAQTMLTLDHVTKGRTTTIVGTGEQKQMRPYGVSRKGAGDKLWDLVHIVKRLCESNEPISYDGRVYKLDRALMSVPPYGATLPKLWVAGGTPDVLYLSGAVADGWVLFGPGAVEGDPDILGAKVREVHDHARAAGRDPSQISVCMQAACLVHEDERELDQLLDSLPLKWATLMLTPNVNNVWKRRGFEHPFGDGWEYSRTLLPYHYSREEAIELTARVPREMVGHGFFVGTPEQVFNQLKPHIDAGVTDLLLCNWAPFGGAQDFTPQLHEALRAHCS
jgi:phthiodiolone/phenolphthiodiolone dimycocerosates ketoreductase